VPITGEDFRAVVALSVAKQLHTSLLLLTIPPVIAPIANGSFKKQEKYITVLPYLSEVDRFVGGAFQKSWFISCWPTRASSWSRVISSLSRAYAGIVQLRLKIFSLEMPLHAIFSRPNAWMVRVNGL
jgi:hypothetical protein